jgi:anti-anti-sigma factor
MSLRHFEHYAADSSTAVIVILDELGEYNYNYRVFESLTLELYFAGYRNLVLDYRQAEFIDSTGLLKIIEALGRAKSRKGKLVMAGVDNRCLKIFRITGLTKFFDFFDTVPDAIRAIEGARFEDGSSVSEQPGRLSSMNGHWFSARTYISEAASGSLVDETYLRLVAFWGMEVVYKFPQERGVWFREYILRQMDPLSLYTRPERFHDMLRIFERQLAGQPSNSANETKDRIHSDLLSALSKASGAVAQIELVLLVKHQKMMAINKLNAHESEHWEQNLWLFQNPEAAFRKLQDSPTCISVRFTP